MEAHRVVTARLQHFLENRRTDGGKVVNLTSRPSFTPQEDSWYSFLLEAESTESHSASVVLVQLKNTMTSSGTEPVAYGL
jgi:hypothetical protein